MKNLSILVLPRRIIEKCCPCDGDHIIISISTPGDSPSCVMTNDHTKEILRLSFYDLCQATSEYPIIFTRGHALWIKNLFMRIM